MYASLRNRRWEEFAARYRQLDAQGIHISSMRNRANRLEEMFVNVVEGAA